MSRSLWWRPGAGVALAVGTCLLLGVAPGAHGTVRAASVAGGFALLAVACGLHLWRLGRPTA